MAITEKYEKVDSETVRKITTEVKEEIMKKPNLLMAKASLLNDLERAKEDYNGKVASINQRLKDIDNLLASLEAA